MQVDFFRFIFLCIGTQFLIAAINRACNLDQITHLFLIIAGIGFDIALGKWFDD